MQQTASTTTTASITTDQFVVAIMLMIILKDRNKTQTQTILRIISQLDCQVKTYTQFI